MILTNGLIVYHGSYIKVDSPQLEMCKAGKDFGLGFYVTTDIEQARRFVKLSVIKAKKNGIKVEEPIKGYVSIYKLTDLDGLTCYEFPNANRDWLHCVALHRKEGILSQEANNWKSYEVIAGKIANDNTNRVITGYINGLYGEVGSESADNIAIGLLMPEKLTNQICLRTQASLDTLQYIDAEEVLL